MDTVNVDTFLLTGLSPQVKYQIGVFAYNQLGNSDTAFVEITTTEKPVGISTAEQVDLSLFPNPVKDVLYLVGAGEAGWELFNLEGHLLDAGRSGSIETAGLAPGIYILKVQLRDGDQKDLRFMKE